MENEPKGPYSHDHHVESLMLRKGCDACVWNEGYKSAERLHNLRQGGLAALWSDGYKAGLARRDGLRKALEGIRDAFDCEFSENEFGEPARLSLGQLAELLDQIEKALAEDEKGEK